jgi:hypothetical protein
MKKHGMRVTAGRGGAAGGRGSLNLFIPEEEDSLLDVATNDAKLSLTGISVGQLVRITGEGNRIEQYTGPDLTVAAVFVTGAGSLSANGIYAQTSTSNDKPFYTKIGDGNLTISWGGGAWHIRDDTSDDLYISEEDVAFPWLVIAWTLVNDGVEPSPALSSVTQGELDAGCTVAGAGSSDADGKYTKRGNYLSRPFYNKIGHATTTPAVDTLTSVVWWDNDNFVLKISDGSSKYQENADSALPWIGVWEGQPVDDPAPTVTRNDIASDANWEVV